MPETFTLGIKAGVKPEIIYEAIKCSSSESKVLDSKAPAIIENKYVKVKGLCHRL